MTERSWVVADTVRTDRKDLFCLAGRDGHHIGTIISGSRRYLERFERQVALMRRCPDMQSLLQRFVNETANRNDHSPRLAALSAEVQELLQDIESPYQEG